MAMIVQHNMTSANANRMLGISTTQLAKATEKLSSGYRINRAADDAAGLAISEKMRSQIRGLDQASANAADGISMIQTAEGALNESHSILQRMRELAVQAANGTETANDRSNLQDEVEQLQEELDRIASDTEFNTMKLLDGTLSGAAESASAAGPKFGVYDSSLQGFLTADIAGVGIKIGVDAAEGGENAIWDPDGRTLTINLHKNTTYNQTQINALIEGARQEDSTSTGTPANITFNLFYGSYTAKDKVDSTAGRTTVAGERATTGEITLAASTNPVYVGSNTMTIKSSKYGADCNITLKIDFAATEGNDKCELESGAVYTDTGSISHTAVYKLSLMSGKEYNETDIERLLAKAGFAAEVKFGSPSPDMPNTLFVTDGSLSYKVAFTGGAGLGDDNAFLGQTNYDVSYGGKGVTLQVGANEGQTMSFSIGEMSSTALGVNASKVNISEQGSASASIDKIDEALEKVSKQRALLGAVQNRLEHTIASLDNTSENLQAAESKVRDVDMAEEMVSYSKFNILQQAGQSMLAQANSSNQGVLTLLQG